MRFEAGFSFFAVMGVLVCTDRDGISFLCLLACVLHELGHLTVMLYEGRPPSLIRLYGGGIHISGGSRSIAAVSAGCAVNLILFALFGLPPWESYHLRLFGVMNLPVALFNLLPIRELDGKLLLDRFLLRVCPAERAVHISELCERIAAALVVPAALFLVFSGRLNFSAIIFFFYLSAVEIFEKI